jgi:SAM-dependent methyltransferase
MGCIIAWITGNARDSYAMKERMKDAYDGKYSNYINKYDELTSFHYEKVSNTLIQKIDCNGKEVVDVGCGTGILSFLALESDELKGKERNIGAVPSYVVCPTSRACSVCYRVVMIKENGASELFSFNQHTKLGGYLVEVGYDVQIALRTMIDRIMSIFE